jgi:predicted transcriptional regulator of viral defense system
MSRLPSELREKPFTLSQAAKLGISRYLLGKLVSDGVVELVARGVYRASKDDISEEDQFRIAALRVGSPSAICLVSALAHHGLTDTIPKKTWIMVPVSKRTRFSDLKLLRTRNPEWHVGIEKREGYSITTLERTIVDSLCARVRIGTQVATEALRRALQTKKTTLGKIMDMAKQLGVVHRVQPYIEALS